MVHAGLSTFEHPASPCREQTNHSGQNQHYCIRNMGWISPEQGSHAVAWKGSDLFGSDWLWHPAVCWRAQIFGHGCHQGGWATVLYPGLLWGLERCPPPPQSNKNVPPPSPLGDEHILFSTAAVTWPLSLFPSLAWGCYSTHTKPLLNSPSKP